MNPRPLPEEVRPAVDRCTHLPSPKHERVERGARGDDPEQNAWDPRRPTVALPNPWLAGLIGTFPILTPVAGSPEVGPRFSLTPRRRSRTWSNSAPGVGDTPSTLQAEWPLPRPPALALLPRETAVALWLNISLSTSWSLCLFSM